VGGRGGWGRPQTDGPALRATVLIKYANMLLDAGSTSYVTSKLYDSLCKDLPPPQTSSSSGGN
jgi:glucoamylase